MIGTIAPGLRSANQREFHLSFANVRPIGKISGGPSPLTVLPLLSNFPGYYVYQDSKFDSNPAEIHVEPLLPSVSETAP